MKAAHEKLGEDQPHVSGDYSILALSKDPLFEPAPRQWGLLYRRNKSISSPPTSPTSVGITPAMRGGEFSIRDQPHVSGDYSLRHMRKPQHGRPAPHQWGLLGVYMELTQREKTSPTQWGFLFHICYVLLFNLISPTYVGISPHMKEKILRLINQPHASEDYLILSYFCARICNFFQKKG